MITAGPAPIVGSGDAARFAFEDPDAPGHEGFECRVDGGAWVACDEGALTLGVMAPGAHTFEVRTCVEGGPPDLRCDPSPAAWRWSVDASPCPLDEVGPRLECAADFTAECVAGGAVVDFAALAPTVSDECGAPVATREGDAVVLGDNPIVFRATDGNGNTSSCLTVISVVDETPPTITCPADVAVDNAPGRCGADVAIGAAVVADGCDAPEALVVVDDAPAQFPVGTTVVTHRVIDRAGHASACEQRVTVVDAELPTLTCTPTMTVDAPADACAWEGALAAQSSDNCGAALELEQASGRFPVGVMPVTFAALDAGGHKRSCATTLTVRDVTAPVVTCGAYEGAAPAVVRATVSDACGASAEIRELACALVGADGEVALDPCPLVARQESLEIGAWPSAGELRARFVVTAEDPSHNVTTVACEVVVPRDADADGVIDARDVCPTVPDPEQADRDGDGIGDACAPSGFAAAGGGGCGAGGDGVVLGLAFLAWRRRRRSAVGAPGPRAARG